jgi:LuxR family quorum sensing-dependent transcriptional regulator
MQFGSNHFTDLMEKFESAKSVPDVWELLLGYAKTFGFGYGVITELPRGPEQLYDIAMSAVVPPEWRQRYSQQRYHRRDPIVLHAAFLRRPYSWAEAANHPRYSKAQKRIVEERREFSITGGFTTPVVGRHTTAIASLCGENPNLVLEERRMLHAASVVALSRIFAMAYSDDTLDVAPLSKRERECLEWASAGKSDRAIGEILSLSEKTVSTYMQRAKMHFGVSTRIQAIIGAIKSREIDF